LRRAWKTQPNTRTDLGNEILGRHTFPLHLLLAYAFVFLFIQPTSSIGAPQQHLVAPMAATVDAKLLRATKFPPEFNQKVDMQKVNLQVMKK